MIPVRQQVVFFPESSLYKPVQKGELLIFIAQKYLGDQAISLKKTCKLFQYLQYDSKRSLRIEAHPPNTEIADVVSRTTRYWRRLAQLRWTQCRDESRKPIFSASSAVNCNVYWRSRPKEIKRFESVVLCKEVAFDRPHVIGLIKTIQVASLGKCLYLKFLAGNPDNLFSPNRVDRCTTALIIFLVRRCLLENYPGIYLEALPAAEIVFEKLGFAKLDNIERKNPRTQPMLLRFRHFHEQSVAAVRFQ